MTQRKIIIANWKMNPETLTEATLLLKGILKTLPKNKNVSIIFAVPSVFIQALKKQFKNIQIASQDISVYGVGAHTGEISALQAKDVGAKFTIVGHSEKRLSGDTNEIISQKIKMAVSSGLFPIICVGENIRDKDHLYLKFVESQIKTAFKNVPKSKLEKTVVAYEPVWTIGSGAVRVATVEESLEMSIFIRRVLSDIFGKKDAEKVPIIYGGSVDEKNGVDFINGGGVSGLLPGRVSLSIKKFSLLIKSIA